MPLSLPSGIFHLIQIKKVRKQDFQKEAQNFRLLTGTHEGGTLGRRQGPGKRVGLEAGEFQAAGAGRGVLSATDVSSRHRNPVGVWARDFPTQALESSGAGR